MSVPDRVRALLASHRGFSVTEIVLVLVIVGMLVAGVLRAQALLDRFRISQATRLIESTAAALLEGESLETGLAALPANPWGGLVGVTGEAVNGDMGAYKVCLSRVPGHAALAIDEALDDAAGHSGRLRATLSDDAVHTAPASEALAGAEVYRQDSEYTLCYRL